jgi:hypothetical protein
MATNLSRTDSLAVGDAFVVWKTADGDFRSCPVTDAIEFIQGNMTDALADSLNLNNYSRVVPTTVANLPTAEAGARAVVTNSNATLTAGIGAIVAGGGANTVPVFFDGTNWRVG